MYLLQVVFQNYVFIHRKVYQCLVWLRQCILPIFGKLWKARFTLQNRYIQNSKMKKFILEIFI